MADKNICVDNQRYSADAPAFRSVLCSAACVKRQCGGIESVPKGQYEAGQVLGMTKGQIFFKVVLLQVVKKITAPMGNEIITLVKDTSLSSVIAIPEILMRAKDFSMQGLIWPLFYSAVFFLAFCGILTLLFSFIEKKLDYYKG